MIQTPFACAVGRGLSEAVAAAAPQKGFLYRFLVLHEGAHLIVPEDRRHGPAFTYVLQLFYRSFTGIPEASVRHLLHRHGLPDYTGPGVAKSLA